jgi:hypothetical protein
MHSCRPLSEEVGPSGATGPCMHHSLGSFESTVPGSPSGPSTEGNFSSSQDLSTFSGETPPRQQYLWNRRRWA